MGLFKKKRKIEEITIIEKNDLSDAVEEKKEKETILPKSNEEMISLINKTYKTFIKGYDSLIYNYYLCRFFSLAIFRRVEEFEELASLERQITNMRQLKEEIENKVQRLNEDKDYADSFIEALFNSINHAYENYLGLSSRIDETRRTKYNTLKLSSLAVIINKKGEDLEKMDKRFTHYVDSFKSLEEASDYIYINSGDLVTNLVKSLIRCIESSNKEEYKKQYTFYYFLKSDVILCLELAEWVDLYNKIRHCVNVLRNVDIANYIDFQGYLEEFEIRYLILMINEERKNIIKGGKDEKSN